jgi:hypothetical protein
MKLDTTEPQGLISPQSVRENPTAGQVTLLDHFAGLALQGFMANPNAINIRHPEQFFEHVAKECYQQAQYMLAAREAYFISNNPVPGVDNEVLPR